MTKLAFEAWQLEQLAHLAVSDPARVERALAAVWEAQPDLLRDVVLWAVDRREIDHERACEILNIDAAELEKRLESLRSSTKTWEQYIEIEAESGTARMSDNHVPVWEVILEYRKVGSVGDLCETFPSLSKGALAAALRYAETHPKEIQDKIAAYESYVTRRQAVIRSEAS
ncbi:MAG: hypothetical protein KF784_04525 [Fimbriimonadaceae bacterium]|nr:hypothetical protein [Fimbriimonadaceae bacterium]